ncbi:hypothetical protein G9F72_018465 [Clostridium estertheticum]|uniref:hypothetical protein n=1 Tax=Clostridium estertheticum TaxID=238834 RepID=UPI0013E91CF5|nr:hypothetical protein [Clostridium estertheticum]MBZ9688316.1 hypothetical protein [Clostridium estertheticum]
MEVANFGEVLKKHWLKMQSLQNGMIARIDASMERIDNLSKVMDEKGKRVSEFVTVIVMPQSQSKR